MKVASIIKYNTPCSASKFVRKLLVLTLRAIFTLCTVIANLDVFSVSPILMMLESLALGVFSPANIMPNTIITMIVTKINLKNFSFFILSF